MSRGQSATPGCAAMKHPVNPVAQVTLILEGQEWSAVCSMTRVRVHSPSPFPPPVASITMNLHRRFMQHSNLSQLRTSSCLCATNNTGAVPDAPLLNSSCM